MNKIASKISYLWDSVRPSAWIWLTRKQDTILKTRQYELDLTLLLAARGGRTTATRL
jgi:hypothetical protein